MKFTGVLAKQTVAKDSKSEREAIVLQTEKETLTLRRFGSNAFQLDEELLEMIGKTITIEGTQHGSLVIFKEFDEE